MRSWLVLAVALLAPWAAVPGHAAPVGAIVNGEFEIAAAAAKAPVCTAFGDTAVNVLPPEQDPGVQDPTAPGATLWPWLVHVRPCEAGIVKAAQWSSSNITQFGDLDGDGDREALIDGSIPADPFLDADQNLWQSYANPQQAFSANFDALKFRVEAGTIPAGAFVEIALSTSPLETATAWPGIFIDCTLTFTNLTPNSFGLVSIDPVDATFSSAWSDCANAEAAWASASTSGRRAILSRLRLVQVAFFEFQTGMPVVIDGVDLAGSKTIAGI